MSLRIVTLQRLVILGVLGLAIAYLVVLRPLARRVLEEEVPLRELRERLEQATLDAGLPRGSELPALRAHLNALRGALEEFRATERQARPRLEHPPEVRRRLEEPFQYVEFLNESQRRIEELAALAQSAKVTLTPGLARGFPRYQPDLARPELLWIQLATVNRVIRAAIHAGVREVNQLSVEPLPLLDMPDVGPPLPPPSAPEAWTILRVHVVLVGQVDALGKVLYALTLTPEELKAAGLPEGLAASPSLFLDQLLLRRDQLEAAEQARLELVVSTAVPARNP